MTPIKFCYYLQGYAELNNNPPDVFQWCKIMEEFNKIDDMNNLIVEKNYDCNAFIFWLKGFIELRSAKVISIDSNQWEIIKKHLSLVFLNVTNECIIDHSCGKESSKQELKIIPEQKLSETYKPIHDIINKYHLC